MSLSTFVQKAVAGFSTWASNRVTGTHSTAHVGAPRSDGGLTPYENINVQNGSGALIKAGPCHLYGLVAENRHATLERFVKLYDTVVAPTVSDTPVRVIPIPALGKVPVTFGQLGLKFGFNCYVRGVTGIAHSDDTAPGANEIVLNAETS